MYIDTLSTLGYYGKSSQIYGHLSTSHTWLLISKSLRFICAWIYCSFVSHWSDMLSFTWNYIFNIIWNTFKFWKLKKTTQVVDKTKLNQISCRNERLVHFRPNFYFLKIFSDRRTLKFLKIKLIQQIKKVARADQGRSVWVFRQLHKFIIKLISDLKIFKMHFSHWNLFIFVLVDKMWMSLLVDTARFPLDQRNSYIILPQLETKSG